MAMPHVRSLFEYVGARVMESSINIPYADQIWSADAYRFDPFFDADIVLATEQLREQAHAFSQSRSSQSAALLNH